MKRLPIKSMITLKLAYHWIINQGLLLMLIIMSQKNLISNMVIIKLLVLMDNKMQELISWEQLMTL